MSMKSRSRLRVILSAHALIVRRVYQRVPLIVRRFARDNAISLLYISPQSSTTEPPRLSHLNPYAIPTCRFEWYVRVSNRRLNVSDVKAHEYFTVMSPVSRERRSWYQEELADLGVAVMRAYRDIMDLSTELLVDVLGLLHYTALVRCRRVRHYFALATTASSYILTDRYANDSWLSSIKPHRYSIS